MIDDREHALAHLADLILNVGRLLRARTPSGPDVVALTETERHVMRLIDLEPGCTPSDIARRGQLQRTNVSTALRGLETKAMIVRRADGGRAVLVFPTSLAGNNLRLLQDAWSQVLTEIVRDDLDTVLRCNELLTNLEAQLSNNTAPGTRLSANNDTDDSSRRDVAGDQG